MKKDLQIGSNWQFLTLAPHREIGKKLISPRLWRGDQASTPRLLS
jgi:hypothetical protein